MIDPKQNFPLCKGCGAALKSAGGSAFRTVRCAQCGHVMRCEEIATIQSSGESSLSQHVTASPVHNASTSQDVRRSARLRQGEPRVADDAIGSSYWHKFTPVIRANAASRLPRRGQEIPAKSSSNSNSHGSVWPALLFIGVIVFLNWTSIKSVIVPSINRIIAWMQFDQRESSRVETANLSDEAPKAMDRAAYLTKIDPVVDQLIRVQALGFKPETSELDAVCHEMQFQWLKINPVLSAAERETESFMSIAKAVTLSRQFARDVSIASKTKLKAPETDVELDRLMFDLWDLPKIVARSHDETQAEITRARRLLLDGK